MSEETGAAPEAAEPIDLTEAPIIDDSITAGDAGFGTEAGDVALESEGDEPIVADAEAIDELKEDVEEAIEDGATEEEVKEMIREFKLKVNGKEYTKTLDLSDEAAVTRELQKALAGQHAMQEKAELEKNLQTEIEQLMANPWEVLKELGLDPDALAEERLRAKVEEMKKSPAQLEREQMQRDLEEARNQLKSAKESEEQARFQQLQEAEGVKLEQEIIEALDSHKTLPQSQKTVSRIADAMLWAMDNGFEDVAVADVIPSVQSEIESELNNFMSELPEELMEQYIGKKNIERMRKKRLQQHKTAPTSKDVTEAARPSKEEKAAERQKAREYFKNLGR